MPERRLRLSGAAIAILTISCALSAGACSRRIQHSPDTQYRIGDQVVVPPLTYTILQSEWKSELGEFPTARIPERNFLLIRLSVTNSGGSEVGIPFLTLEDARGETFRELQDGAGVDNWLGILRSLKPAETEEGWILFDAPRNSYRLRIPDTTDINRERIIPVELPLRLE